MSLSAPTPPLLLTKRLTSFLRSNLSPQIHTALLATLSGKLLAHASPHTVSTLRTQSTVAASVWGIYSSGAAITDALPQNSTRGGSRGEPKSAVVTIQLSAGVLVVRKLKCGLLFVCIGPAADGTGTPADQGHTAGMSQQQQQQSLAVPSHSQHQGGGSSAETHSSSSLGSPSEVASVVSAAPTTNSITTTGSVSTGAVMLMRRQAEELARWLDDKLGSLGVPEEGSGGEIR